LSYSQMGKLLPRRQAPFAAALADK
jgi:hypothetical protein